MICLIITINLLIVNCFIENEICDTRNTCKYSKESEIPVCYCDEECLKYNDCCKEYILSYNKTINFSNTRFYSCVGVKTGGKNILKVGSFMVDKCKNSGSTCDVNSGHLESIIPVSDEGDTFRNSYCAECNGVYNFTYWNIIYDIPMSIEVKSLYFQTLFSEEILSKLENEILPNEEYNLFPPDFVSPRYCTTSTLNGNGRPDIETYQNFVLCKKSLYKNPDKCIQHRNVVSKDIKCISYDSTYIARSKSILQDIDTVPQTLQLLLQFEQRKQESKQPNQERNRRISPTFIHKGIIISVEISLLKAMTKERSFQTAEESVMALIVFLKDTRYRLTSQGSWLRTEHVDGLKFAARLIVRAKSELSINELRYMYLLNLHISLKYCVSNVDVVAVGHVNVAEDLMFPMPSSTKRRPLTDMSNISLSSHDVSLSCKNISFLTKSRIPTAIVYDVQCMDNIMGLINGGNNEHVCFISVCFTLLSLMCSLWCLTYEL